MEPGVLVILPYRGHAVLLDGVRLLADDPKRMVEL